jgi:hypothetical protein
MNKPFKVSNQLPGRQRGALTMFTGIMILLLLTELLIYAVSVGVFEQRKSGNDLRQKLAFHAAESGLNHGKEFFIANRALAVSAVTDLLPDGSDGWLSTGAERWQKCSDVNLSAGSGTHPCYAEEIGALRDDSYYYSFAGSTELPVDTNAIIPGTTEQVTVQALLCMPVIDLSAHPVVQGCTTDASLQDDRYYVISLLSRGEADCDSGSCTAEALLVEKIAGGSPGSGGGSPAVPLVTKSTFPPNGTAEIVPNPDGYGEGVAVSAWLNNNPSCPADPVMDAEGGSWATCEREEFYGVTKFPDDYACPWPACACKESENDKLLSDSGKPMVVNFDILMDEDFPCDLFLYMFGIEKTPAAIAAVKGMATVIDDCSVLDENSTGIFWSEGAECNIKDRVGSAETPVLLIAAATQTHFNAGAEIFGVVFATDAEDPAAELWVNGHATVYGQVIVDETLGKFQGTFQVVYLANVIEKALDQGAVGVMPGGWTDFHAAWQ